MLHEDTPLCEDEALLPHAAAAATALSVKRSHTSEAAEAALPAVSLLRVLPKWLRVTRLWFEGAHPGTAFRQPVHRRTCLSCGLCARCCLGWALLHGSCVRGAGSERKAACGWACAVVVLSFATTLLLVAISYLHRDLDTAMSGKDEGAPAAPCRAPPAAARPAAVRRVARAQTASTARS